MAIPIGLDVSRTLQGFSHGAPQIHFGGGERANIGPDADAAAGLGIQDLYAEPGQGRGLDASALPIAPSFSMPSASEMAELLKDLMAKGIGRKQAPQAGANGQGANLGQMFAALGSMLGNLGAAGGGQGMGQGMGPSPAGAEPSAAASKGMEAIPKGGEPHQHRASDPGSSEPKTKDPADTQHGDHVHGPSASNAKIPAGLRPNARKGAQEVRNMGFDGVIGGTRARKGPRDTSDHPNGNAIDVMTNNNRAQGRQIAEHFRANHAQHNVKYVIFEQQIASAKNNWQWRPMADRGNPTANHMDHPHISFY